MKIRVYSIEIKTNRRLKDIVSRIKLPRQNLRKSIPDYIKKKRETRVCSSSESRLRVTFQAAPYFFVEEFPYNVSCESWITHAECPRSD